MPSSKGLNSSFYAMLPLKVLVLLCGAVKPPHTTKLKPLRAAQRRAKQLAHGISSFILTEGDYI